MIFLTLASCTFFKNKKILKSESPLKALVLIDESKDINHRFNSQNINNKIIIINFWASWCGPCQEEMPSLLKLVTERSSELILLSINGDNSEKEMKKFMGLFPNFKGENIYIFYDGSRTWSQTYSVTGFPETFIYDQKNNFIKRYQGAIDFKGNEFSKLISSLFVKP